MNPLDQLTPHQQYLLYTLVRTAVADLRIAPTEVAFIGHIAGKLGVDAEGRERLNGMLLARERIPWEQAEVPSTGAERFSVYEETLALAASDGEIQVEERAFMSRLAVTLELSDEDVRVAHERGGLA